MLKLHTSGGGIVDPTRSSQMRVVDLIASLLRDLKVRDIMGVMEA
jgi:hypothetical protein